MLTKITEPPFHYWGSWEQRYNDIVDVINNSKNLKEHHLIVLRLIDSLREDWKDSPCCGGDLDRFLSNQASIHAKSKILSDLAELY